MAVRRFRFEILTSTKTLIAKTASRLFRLRLGVGLRLLLPGDLPKDHTIIAHLFSESCPESFRRGNAFSHGKYLTRDLLIEGRAEVVSEG